MRNRSAWLWIYRQIGPYRPAIFRLALWSSLAALVHVVVSVLSGRLLDISTTEGNLDLRYGAIAVLALVAVQILLSFFASVGRLRASNRLTVRLRHHFFATLVRKKYPEIVLRHSGDLLNRFTSDTDIVVSGAVDIVPELANMITMIIAGCAALIIFNGWIILAILMMLSVIAAFGRVISKRYKQLHRDAQEAEGKTRSFFQESISNLIILKSFNGEQLVQHKLGERLDDSYNANMRRGRASILISVLMNALFTFGYYGVLILGAYQLSVGHRAMFGMTYGTLLVYLQLISRLRAPMQNISGIFSRSYMMAASAERLIELETLPDEEDTLDTHEQRALSEAFRSLEVEHLSFAYDTEPILADCSFTVHRGDLVAVSASSGYGKTTLLKLLLGLYEPDAGRITVNGSRTVGAATRSLFAYVPQGNHVLSGTIRENLTLFTPDADEQKIAQALRIAALDKPVANLPNGLDTVLTENGGGLSEGQLQRLAIARALLTDSPILLLDEATANLDEQTERQLLHSIREMTDKTVLLITHRPAAMEICDHVLRGENRKFEMTDKEG